jgi:aminopeptidase N
MLIRNFVFPDHFNNAKNIIDKTPNMIKVFSDLFGQYPFIKEKYGQAEFPWSGGMEHQTCTSLGGWGEFLLVHELSHQWWGDMVTCKDFHHIWMNEGFANYCEALYSEKVYGQNGYFNLLNSMKWLGSGTVYVPDLSNVSRIFDGNLSYNKGAWVLHMLRHVVGDATFFNILRSYYGDRRYQYKVVTTENFRDLCQLIYNKDLDWFFQQWIYQESCPNYQCIKQVTPSGSQSKVKLVINQLQTNYIFKMPIDISISTSKGDTTFVVLDSLKSQEFYLTVNGSISSIDLDKNNWILKTVAYLTSTQSLTKPDDYNLFQNYPNPFNNETIINYSLREPGEIKIKLYDILGKEIQTILTGYYSAGKHTATFNAKNLPSGTYYYELTSRDFKEMRKLVLLK